MRTTQTPPHGYDDSSMISSYPPAKLTRDQSLTYSQPNLPGFDSIIFSLALEDGPSPYPWQNGQQTNQSGQALALANHFPMQANEKEQKDERHLWPEFHRLISQCRPPVVLGEQVASPDGREWLAGIFTDLEDVGYAVAGADLCAASVASPHARQRLFWVADAGRIGSEHGREPNVIPSPASQTQKEASQRQRSRNAPGCSRSTGRMGDTTSERPQGHAGNGKDGNQPGRIDEEAIRHARQTGFWTNARTILCIDGKHRRIPVEPALFPLADGLPYKLAPRGSIRPALIKGIGNAIVPQVAAEFVRAYLETK